MSTKTLFSVSDVSDLSKTFLSNLGCFSISSVIALFSVYFFFVISLSVILISDLSISFSPAYSHSKVVSSSSQVLSLLRSYLADTHRPQSGNEQDCDLSSGLFPRLWIATR